MKGGLNASWKDGMVAANVVGMVSRRLAALRIADPDQWERQVVEAFLAEDGRYQETADRLQISVRTLHRWVGDCPRLARRFRGGPTGYSAHRNK